MTSLEWGSAQDRKYDSGISHGMYYPKNSDGVVWTGLSSVDIDEEDLGSRYIVVDGVKRFRVRRRSELTGTINAFAYPESFFENTLMPRSPKSFGMSYRTKHEGAEQIHLLYNVLVEPSSVSREYENATSYSWSFTTRPLSMLGGAPCSHLIVDTGVAYAGAVADLERLLYGSDIEAPRLPDSEEIFEVFESNAILVVVDNGDGTWTATGPESMIKFVNDTTFEITSPSAVYVSEDRYTIRSY